uniref:Ribosomal protein L28 n=1 Tax=Thorea hispida TaxID=202687 RepID=A0A1C9CAD8_9FLOR|nr:ribosomal protein L28 [Thorea hispida]AOM65353.1 ribosomal protein L28 [Thorea hispida]
MPKYCQITGKIKNNAYSVSHSHVRTKKNSTCEFTEKESMVQGQTKMDKHENIY